MVTKFSHDVNSDWKEVPIYIYIIIHIVSEKYTEI